MHACTGADITPDVDVDKEKYAIRASINEGDDDLDVKFTIDTVSVAMLCFNAVREVAGRMLPKHSPAKPGS